MTTLYLCEKPSQGKDIAAVLGVTGRNQGFIESGDIVVTWCIGHLLSLANPEAYGDHYKQWSIETLPIVPANWKMVPQKKTVSQFRVIQRLLKNAQGVVLATDADREGEVIGREILEQCHYRGRVERLWLSALDPDSIRTALANLRTEEQTRALYFAGLGRSRADWLIGITLTRAYTILSKRAGGDRVVSVGRVQTPTLKLIVDRDREIEQFTPVPFYTVNIDCDVQSARYTAKWLPIETENAVVDQEGRCLDQNMAQRVAHEVTNQSGVITKLERTKKSENAPLPFDLSSLQIEASARYGLDANDVLAAAQSLYETHKATTYPRTDCRYLPVNQFVDAQSIIDHMIQADSKWASENPVGDVDATLKSRCWNDKKITAHHAIIPTNARVDISGMSGKEYNLYALIRRNYLMQFFSKYEFEATTCITVVQGHTFLTQGRVDLALGWKVLDQRKSSEDNDHNTTLPDTLTQNSSVSVVNVEAENKLTQPPKRFTSGTLIAAMKNVGRLIENAELRKVLKETSGIGTEATRANIIDVLLERGYLKQSRKQLISTDFGRSLIDAVPGVLKDPGTTALWEQVLEEIAQGQQTLEHFMSQQEQFLKQMVDYLQRQEVHLQKDVKQYPCPECGKPLRKRKGFWGCSNYPDCKATLPDNRGKPGKRKPKVQTYSNLAAGHLCPKCENGQVIQKTFSSGKNEGKQFYACTGYPACRLFAWPNAKKANAE